MPLMAEVEEVFTMLPRVASRCGSAALQNRKVPVRFTSITFCHCASVISWACCSSRMPATFTSTSSLPKRSMQRATASFTCSSRDTSQGALSGVAPVLAHRATVSSSASLARSTRNRLAPSAASRSSQARPIPDAAPVIITTLPSNLRMAACSLLLRRIQKLAEAVARVGAEGDLLEHTHALPGSRAGAHHLLDVLVLDRHLVQVVDLPALPADGELALPHAVAPARMRVPDALHAEADQRLEPDVVTRAVLLDQADLGRARAARAGQIDEAVLDPGEEARVRVLDARNLVRILVDRADHAVPVPGVSVGVLEQAHVRAAIGPVERRPQEEHLRRDLRRRAARVGNPDGPDPPGAVLGAEGAPRVDREAAPGVPHLALPAPELIEARGVHRGPPAPPRLAPLLDVRRARDPLEVAGDAGLVLGDHDAQPLHRLLDVDAERAHLHLRRLARDAARGVEGVLLAVAHDREAAVHDAEVRIDGGADPEVVLAVLGVAVEPVAVVGVAVAGGGLRDRLGRLMDRVVVEAREHRAPPGRIVAW